VAIKDLVEQLYPLNRQINSADADKALDVIGKHIPNWEVHRYAPGTECWTWTVPKRWVLNYAELTYDDYDDLYANDSCEVTIIVSDPLEVVAYSQPIDAELTWDELAPHLHYVEDRPDAIPWVSRHYEDDWGFCLPKNVYDTLPRDATYRVVIDAEFTDEAMSVGVGQINYRDIDADLALAYDIAGVKDRGGDCLLLCAHICHPMQANDDLSGVAVLCDVARRLASNPLPDDALGARFMFTPETIGSTAYLSQNEWLIPHIKAGVFVEMAGTDGDIRLQNSHKDEYPFDSEYYEEWPKHDNIDRVAVGVVMDAVDDGTLKQNGVTASPFGTVRCNDEKVINGPGVDIPCISLMRWPYDEYHTSDDNPDIISEEKLVEMADVVERIVRIYCTDYVPKRTFTGYLNTRRYGIRVDWEKDWDLHVATQNILHLLEGNLSVFEISERVGLDYWKTRDWIETLREKGLVTVDSV
jgi:aminopeptidase-like protein